MRAHIIEDGKVTNTVIVDFLDWTPNLIDADLVGGGIGDSWDGEKIIPAPVEFKTVEAPVDIRKIALNEAKEALDSTDTKTIVALKDILRKIVFVIEKQ
jgi:hypothetical protein